MSALVQGFILRVSVPSHSIDAVSAPTREPQEARVLLGASSAVAQDRKRDREQTAVWKKVTDRRRKTKRLKDKESEQETIDLEEEEEDEERSDDSVMDGSMPCGQIVVDLQNLNRNLTRTNVAVVVPLDMSLVAATTIDRKKGGLQDEVDEVGDSNKRFDLRLASGRPNEEAILVLSLLRYLVDQNCLNPDEARRAADFESDYLLHEQHDDVEGQQQQQQHRLQQASEWVKVAMAWLQSVLERKRLVFLMELYLRNAPAPELVVTRIWPHHQQH